MPGWRVFSSKLPKTVLPLGALESVPVERLELAEELELIRQMIQFNDVLEERCANSNHIAWFFIFWSLAGEFHRYYNRHRVVSRTIST